MSESRPVDLGRSAEAEAEMWPCFESHDVASDAAPDPTTVARHDAVDGAIPLPDSVVPAGAQFRLPAAASAETGWLGTISSVLAHIVLVAALLIYNPWRDSGFLGDYDEIPIELVEAPPPEQAVNPQENAPIPLAEQPQALPEPAPATAQPGTPAAAVPEIKDEQLPPQPQVEQSPAVVVAPPPEQPAPALEPPPATPPEPSPSPPPELPAATAPAEEPAVAPPLVEPLPTPVRPAARPPDRVSREKAEAAARERAAQAKREQEAKAAAAARERSAQAKREQEAKAAAESQARAEASAKAQANPAAAQAYRGAVVSHLAGFKRYPPGARARGAQGSPVVAFSLNGSGQVVSVSLARGSGDSEIDAEVVAMVRRASPFPAPPPGAPRAFSATINFHLQ